MAQKRPKPVSIDVLAETVSKNADTYGTSRENGEGLQVLDEGGDDATQQTQMVDARVNPYGDVEDLKFLDSIICTPNLSDERVIRQGYMRNYAARPTRNQVWYAAAGRGIQAAKELAEAVQSTNQQARLDGRSCYTRVRRVIGKLLLSTIMQTLILLIILLDCVLTIELLFNVEAETDKFRRTLSTICVIVFTLDIIGRNIYFGRDFYRSWLNCMELVLVLFMYVELVLFADGKVPLEVVRVLRPIFRSARFIRLAVRLVEKGRSFNRILRHTMSGDRSRFTEDGFDLDLAYISTDSGKHAKIITTSMPGYGTSRLMHNPMQEVARFLNERHGNRYIIVNTTERHSYPTDVFFHRYLHFPIEWHGVPTLDGLMHFCRLLKQFLGEHDDNIVVVHSKHGQGRACLVAAALLIYLGEFSTVAAAIACLEDKRTDHDKKANAVVGTLDNSSQQRFLEYFAARVHGIEENTQPRTCRIRTIALYGYGNSSRLDVSCFQHPGSRVSMAPGLREALGATEEMQLNFMKEQILPHDGETDHLSTMSENTTNLGSSKRNVMHLPLKFASSTQVIHKVQELVQECEFDSSRAGAKHMVGEPVITSKSEANDHRIQPMKVGSKDKDHRNLLQWDLVDCAVQGEIVFEVHRHDKADKSFIEQPEQLTMLQRLLRTPGQVRRTLRYKGAHRTVEAMIFSCWLHTSYIEYDEEAKTKGGVDKDPGLVSVSFGRFDLDKAVGEKSMRNYNSTLKLVIDFQADRSEGMRAKNAEALIQKSSSNWANAIATRGEMSDTYDLGWINWTLTRLWPYTTPGLGQLLKESIEPSLQDLLPPPFSNLNFSKFAFGESVPELGPITACARDQEGYEVTLDIMVKYDGPVEVSINSAAGELGVSHLLLQGCLSVKLKPIRDQLPVVEGVHLFFMNCPDIDLTFGGSLEVANTGYFKKKIKETVAESLYDIIVIPNCVVIDYSSQRMAVGDSMTTFRDVLPRGILRIHVVEARDLPSKSSFCGNRLPDPFVSLHFGSQNHQTGIATSTINPCWNEFLDFFLYDEQQLLTVRVEDCGLATSLLAEVEKITVGPLVEAGNEGYWVTLQDKHGGQARAEKGRLCLKVTIFDLLSDAAEVERHTRDGRISERSTGSHPPSMGEVALHGGSSASLSSAGYLQSPVSRRMLDLGKDLEAKVRRGALRAQAEMSNFVATPKDSAPADVDKAAVGVVICRLLAGHAPQPFYEPGKVSLRVALGKSRCTKLCSEAVHPEFANVTEEICKVIIRLHRKGSLDIPQIADLVDVDHDTVQRIIRKAAEWNLEMLKRLCVMIRPIDLDEAPNIDIEIVVKGRPVAAAQIPLHEVLQTSGLRLKKEIRCTAKNLRSTTDQSPRMALFSAHSIVPDVDLDMELRVLSLTQRTRAKKMLPELIEHELNECDEDAIDHRMIL